MRASLEVTDYTLPIEASMGAARAKVTVVMRHCKWLFYEAYSEGQEDEIRRENFLVVETFLRPKV